jgi:hypothetical protein
MHLLEQSDKILYMNVHILRHSLALSSHLYGNKYFEAEARPKWHTEREENIDD